MPKKQAPVKSIYEISPYASWAITHILLRLVCCEPPNSNFAISLARAKISLVPSYLEYKNFTVTLPSGNSYLARNVNLKLLEEDYLYNSACDLYGKKSLMSWVTLFDANMSETRALERETDWLF